MDRKRKLEVPDVAAVKRAAMPGGEMGAGGGINPFTGKQYSQRYHDILSKRTGGALDVYIIQVCAAC